MNGRIIARSSITSRKSFDHITLLAANKKWTGARAEPSFSLIAINLNLNT
jgi:hypothetical protein